MKTSMSTTTRCMTVMQGSGGLIRTWREEHWRPSAATHTTPCCVLPHLYKTLPLTWILLPARRQLANACSDAAASCQLRLAEASAAKHSRWYSQRDIFRSPL